MFKTISLFWWIILQIWMNELEWKGNINIQIVLWTINEK